MPALFVNHLTVMDFTYLDPARGLVGESWIVDIVLEGALDEQGMVFDFGDVKKQIKRAIDGSFDHKLVVPAQMDGLTIDDADNSLTLSWQDTQGRPYRHQSPAEAVALLPVAAIDMPAAARWLGEVLRRFLPDNVQAIKLKLRTEAIAGAYYHYSHGLKKHLGNCQRIAHGHRSRIEIYLDGKRSPQQEALWAQRWQDIYLGTHEDVVEQSADAVTFAYHGSQGPFSLTVPLQRVYFIACDSTVELLAEHLADQVALACPGHALEIHAYEGVWKGAIARR